MMIHFVLHWPTVANTQEHLWPFAVDYAGFMHNCLPMDQSDWSPFKLFTQTKFPHYHHLQRAHIFGCPVYVLDPRLQNGHKIPKWQFQNCVGVHLGVSKQHISTVHLILNLSTGVISP